MYDSFVITIFNEIYKPSEMEITMILLTSYLVYL